MFILDVANKLAWAIEGTGDADTGELPKARIWGALAATDTVPKREITQWLARHRVPAGRVTFVPLPYGFRRYTNDRVRWSTDAQAPRPTACGPKADISPVLPAAQTQGARNSAIALDREGGTFLVPVVINGELTLKFTLDSGASDVSIPADVVLTLLRTGTLTHDDFLGTKTYRLADGSTIPSQTFRIRSLRVGDRVLEDVTASVAPVSGTLLLGQSFLSRFKTWSIDNERRVLLLAQ